MNQILYAVPISRPTQTPSAIKVIMLSHKTNIFVNFNECNNK